MSKLTAKDIADMKPFDSLRFHILHSRSNLTVKCRLWHPDGDVLGTANGGGYDRAGAALGQAIEKLFGEELKGLTPGYIWPPGDGIGAKVPHGLYGLTQHRDGKMSLDGACGIEQMLKVLRALGFTDTELYETGKMSSMVVARRKA